MLIDAHTHLTFAAFDDDREAVFKRAKDAGVGIIVNVGTQIHTSKVAVQFAEKHNEAYATIGLHPIHTEASYHDEKELGGGTAAKAFTSQGEEFDHDAYLELARHEKTVAIGECGLDYYRLKDASKNKQKQAFISQIKLAHEVQKPLMIHCRNAFGDLLEILKANSSELNEAPGIIHFFSGSVKDAEALTDMGFYFTFGGVITFTNDYDDAVRLIPADRILSETDAPYVAPAPHRGKRNEPAYIRYVVRRLAELKGMDENEIANVVAENAGRIFGINIK